MTSLALALLLSLPRPPAPPAPRPQDDSDDQPVHVDVQLHAGDGGPVFDARVGEPGDDGGGTQVYVGPNGVRIQGGHNHGHRYEKIYHPGGDRSRVGTGNLTIHAGEDVADTVAIGGSIDLEPGAVVHDAVAVGGTVHVGSNATVQGDAVAVGGSVELASFAKVVGDSVAVGGKVEEAVGAEVGGDHVSLGLPGLGTLIALATGLAGLGVFSPFWLIGSLFAKLIVFLALGLIILALWPRRLEQLSDELFRIPGRSVLLGVLSMPAIPLLTVLLCITIIGIVLVPVEMLAVGVMSALGFSALALALGRRLPFAKGQSAVQLGIGALLLALVLSVPVLGWLIAFACWLWVFGAVVATRFGHMPPPETLPTPPSAAV